MILYSDCDYFNNAQDDPSAPEYGYCEDCYRYKICLEAKMKENEGSCKL